MKLTASIIDYIGTYQGGILTSVGLMFENKFYDAIFYYTENKMIINIDDSLKEKIGDIELHEDYVELMENIINKVDPYDEIIKDLKEIKLDENTGN